MDRPDHYATLGVPRDANAKQIRDAYRKLARKYHPDLHPGEPSAEDALKHVNEAYEVLSDPDKRRKYTMLGSDWNAILRDEDTLRRETGFAPVPETAADSAAAGRSGRVYRDRTDSYIALANSARVVLVGLALAGLALLAPYGWRNRAKPAQPRLASFQKTAASIGELSGALNQFVHTLDEGVERWRQVCVERSTRTDEFLESTVKPRYLRQYRDAAETVITLITRAESAGVFAVRLTASDQAALHSLLALRDELREAAGASPLDCRNDLPVHWLKALAKQAAAGRRCLDQLSRLPPESLTAQRTAGHDVCEASAGAG